MARQSFIWTALPNGYTDDGLSLRLSVLISPRLDPQASPQTLKSFFPDWADWPTTLKQAVFRVQYSGTSVLIPASQTVGAMRVDDRLGLPDTAVWQSLFKDDLFVRPFVFSDMSTHNVLTYDYATMVAGVESLYGELAANAEDSLPTISDFVGKRNWGGLLAIVRALDREGFDEEAGLRDPRRLFRLLQRGKAQAARRIPSGTSDTFSLENELVRFQLFHTPPATPKSRSHARTDDARITAKWLEYQRTPLPSKAEFVKKLDFHQYVASMGSYPTLLRRLGLAIDLLLPVGSLPSAADAPLTVDVEFPAGALQITRSSNANPETRTLLSSDRFHAVSATTSPFKVRNGLLDLDPTRFSLLQLDADSAWLKIMNFARSLDRRTDPDTRRDSVSRHEDRVGAPSLRAAGLMLVHQERGANLSQRFTDNKTGNTNLEGQFQGSGIAVSLTAEDLVRGYRIDVRDAMTGRWRSLFRRTARYELNHGALVVEALDEEGTLQLAATKSSDATSNADVLYVHEAVMSWNGWSLAAPPPGRAIQIDDTVDNSVPTTEQELPPGIDFKSRFKPTKGSLPRLRIGRAYSVRARAVDLAGNSLPPQETDFGWEASAAPSREYLRLEPLEGPVIALLSQAGAITPLGAGESMSRMAIRSFNNTAEDNTTPTSQVTYRAVAPPRVSVRDAELHGMLDVGSGVASFLFSMLANEKDVDPRDSSAAIREVKMPLQSPLDAAAVDTYMAVYEAGRGLTYLPDPLAMDVCARIFEHPNIAENEIITIPLYPTGQWPDAAPFTIVVADDPAGKPHFDANTRQLNVPLGKAVKASVRLSMRLSPAALQKMAVFRWMAPADQAALTERAMNGQHWMLTPWRVVEMVHAVQRPLLTPEINSVSIANRAPSATSARPVLQVTCSLASTDRLDLHAEWHEPLDNPALAESKMGPSDRMRRDVAFHIKITDAGTYAQQVLGDAGGGYPDHTISGPDSIGINAIAASAAMPAPAVQTKTHEFHDTRYRRIEYWFDATTQFREFLPASLLTRVEAGVTVAIEDHIKVTGERVVSWVPSSAPPPAPKVLYVVPTFGWVREVNEAGRILRWRQGGGLRVYLDRPWNESGYGEMLAVVLPPRNFTDNPDTTPQGRAYKDYVTQWGNDPIWDSAFVAGLAPQQKDFPRARVAPDATGSWLPPGAPASEADQQPGAFSVPDLLRVPRSTGQSAPVEIAPHDVFFDASRQLWYCDIEVETGASYFPFIRLALARYQPTSCPGVHLSNVVLADMIALSADRWFNVTPTQEPGRLRVVVSGIRVYESSGHHEAANAPSMSLTPLGGPVETLVPAQLVQSTAIEVWVEELDERYGEDFGWTRVISAAVSGRDPWDAKPDENLARAKSIGPAILAQAAATERLARMSIATARGREPLAAAAQSMHLITPWQTLWEGEVQLPPPSGRRRRLVVAEYEEYLVDDSKPYDKVPTRKDWRMVFVEHVELE